MKIALITPPWRYSILKGKRQKPFLESIRVFSDVTLLGVLPPTGILYIASALKAQGHSAYVLDGYFHSRAGMLKELKKINPDVIGISTISCLWKGTCKLAEEIIKHFPDAKIILGGHHVNYAAERCIADIPGLTSIVIGDGESAMIDIVNKIKNGENVEKIYRTSSANGLIHKIFEPDFDALDGPISRYIPNIGLYDRVPFLPIFTTKGCNRACAFCNVGQKTAKLQVRDALDIVEQIKRCITKYNIKTMNFFDDSSIFENNRNEAVKLCQEIIRQKLCFTWSIYLTNFGLDKELLKIMKDSGCFRIHCAVESGVQKNRDYIRGNSIPLSKIEEQICQIKEAGIETYGRFMFGIFGESYEDGIQTIKYACSLPLDYVSFIRCLLAPGTKMFKDLMELGRVNKDINTWSHYNDFYRPFPMENSEVSRLIRKGYLNFYFRPTVLYDLLKKCRSFHEVKKMVVITKRFLEDAL